MSMRSVLLFSTLVVLAACAATAAPSTTVDYPEGYRTWTHVKSMWLGPEHGLADPFEGIHHIYVNAPGQKALQAGRPLPDGSVLVFDLLDGELAGHAISEGERKFLGVMQKDAGRWASTGGWGFEVFPGDSKAKRAVEDGGKSCFVCHESRKENGYVFTEWRP